MSIKFKLSCTVAMYIFHSVNKELTLQNLFIHKLIDNLQLSYVTYVCEISMSWLDRYAYVCMCVYMLQLNLELMTG